MTKVGLTSVSTLSLCLFCSKAERPPSLSLYPSGEGMVRGGLGGARMMPGKDIWQVSELGRSTFCSAYQVGQTAALSSVHSLGSGRGRGRPYCCPSCHTHTDHLHSHACLCHC